MAWCLNSKGKTSPSLKDVVEGNRAEGCANVNNKRYLSLHCYRMNAVVTDLNMGFPRGVRTV
jgi:hypothetical protein